jgi:hypothetical protein
VKNWVSKFCFQNGSTCGRYATGGSNQREVQRRYRERKKERTKELEQKVEILQARLNELESGPAAADAAADAAAKKCPAGGGAGAGAGACADRSEMSTCTVGLCTGCIPFTHSLQALRLGFNP